MAKELIIENLERKKLGEIIFSKGKFKLNIPFFEEKEKLEKLLKSFTEKGIKDLGEVILTEPIKIDHPLFFDEVQNQLARKGYIPIEKN